MSLFGARFPYFSMQELNLDWFLAEIKRIMGWFPESGNAGQVLMKTEDGTKWEDLEAVDLNINNLPEDTEISETDKLIFYDVSATANRKITGPNLLNSFMSDAYPLMDGTASAGTSKKPARYDHRHPTDTSRAPASYFQNNALKVENGGTGATYATQARQNLGIGEVAIYDVLPITKGGTGADNPIAAKAALGISSFSIQSSNSIDLTIPSGAHYMLMISSRTAGSNGFYNVIGGTDNNVYVHAIEAGTNLTLTPGTNTLNIAVGTSYTVFGMLFSF